VSGIQMMLLGAVAQAAASSPVYQSSTTASKSTGTDLTINIPTSTAAGDLLVAVLVANATSGWNQATGWTRLVNSITDPSTSLQYKIADGTEGATQVFVGASVRGSGTIMRFTNAGVPYVGTVQTGSATSSQTAPSVDILSDNSLVLSVFTADASAQTWTGTRTNPIVSFGTQCSFDVSYDEVNTGASGTDTATMSTADTYACFQVGIPNADFVPPITYVAQASNSATATTTVVVDKPTGTVQNDILVAFAMTSSSNTWTAPAGWTEVLDTSGRGCFYKDAGSSEGANYTFTLSGSSDLHVVILCYRNASWGQIGTLSASLADPTVAPGITVATDSSLVIDFVTRGSAATYDTPVGWTDRYEATNTSTIYLLDKAFNSGATGDITVDATSGNGRSVLLALSPGSAAQAEYITNVSDTTDASTYTFTGVNIGGPGLIVVNLHGGQGTGTAWTVSSCTIGGVSATIHVNPSDPDSCAIASAVITSGTTADISFTATTTLLRAVVGVYRITGYQSATPVATASQTTNASTDTRTVTLDTSANGVVIAGTSHADSSTFTWTNATENYDVTLAETSNSFAGASVNTTGGNLTITVVSTDAAPANGYTLSAVSWR